MNLLYPKVRLSLLPAMLGYAALGALLAGFYGILHDQITYTISPEYFTRLKFAQFHYADFGWPPRIFVLEIGFLATWWVGFMAGWFLARVTIPAFPSVKARRHCFCGFGIIFGCAFAGAMAGFALGLLLGPRADFSAWQGFVTTYGVVDLKSFVRVAYIHNASYLGGLIGLVIALLYVRRMKRAALPSTEQKNQPAYCAL